MYVLYARVVARRQQPVCATNTPVGLDRRVGTVKREKCAGARRVVSATGENIADDAPRVFVSGRRTDLLYVGDARRY